MARPACGHDLASTSRLGRGSGVSHGHGLPPTLKRGGVASAVLIVLVAVDGLMEVLYGDRGLGAKMLVLALALVCLVAVGWYISPFRPRRLPSQRP